MCVIQFKIPLAALVDLAFTSQHILCLKNPPENHDELLLYKFETKKIKLQKPKGKRVYLFILYPYDKSLELRKNICPMSLQQSLLTYFEFVHVENKKL